ncbi:hypothetical protein J6590_099827, partial [Homalodisca vitripennis]
MEEDNRLYNAVEYFKVTASSRDVNPAATIRFPPLPSATPITASTILHNLQT